MSKIFICPHCRTQNFATQARLRKTQAVPLTCWKCGKRIKETSGNLNPREKRKQRGGEKHKAEAMKKHRHPSGYWPR